MWELEKESASAWVDDYAPSMGAAISYYTLFSISYRMSAAKVQLYIRRCDNEVSGLRRSSLTRQSERGH